MAHLRKARIRLRRAGGACVPPDNRLQLTPGSSLRSRTFLYTVGGRFTLFLSQILFMPAEKLLLEGSKFTANVDYQRGGSGEWLVVESSESPVK